MKPRLLFKCIEGSIIGFPDVDNGESSNAETWLVAQEQTEIIFFKKEAFMRLWSYQRLDTDKQIIISSFQKNMFFHFLTQEIKYSLVYENMSQIVYLPGQTVVF